MLNTKNSKQKILSTKKSFYRKNLPCPPAISFSSTEGRKIFRQSLTENNLECFFPLSEQFRTQDEPAFCAISSLTMVLNALSIDPGRVWKGPQRQFHEGMLDCCESLEVIKQSGIVFHKAACLARCNGAYVSENFAQNSDVEIFRKDVKHSVRQSNGQYIIVSYDRSILHQTGSGHFSPIAGYHSEKDLVLILDVARFKYPPHQIPLELLFKAMCSLDSETNMSRGQLILKPNNKPEIKGFKNENRFKFVLTMQCARQKDLVALYKEVELNIEKLETKTFSTQILVECFLQALHSRKVFTRAIICVLELSGDLLDEFDDKNDCFEERKCQNIECETNSINTLFEDLKTSEIYKTFKKTLQDSKFKDVLVFSQCHKQLSNESTSFKSSNNQNFDLEIQFHKNEKCDNRIEFLSLFLFASMQHLQSNLISKDLNYWESITKSFNKELQNEINSLSNQILNILNGECGIGCRLRQHCCRKKQFN